MKVHTRSGIKSLVMTGLVTVALGSPAAMAANPCNPCSPKPQSSKAANPCAAKNPCAAEKAKKKSPAAAKKAANPCAPGNPCAAK